MDQQARSGVVDEIAGENNELKQNALSKAASAYLRSAMDQPVDWMEWSDQAFARARQEDKPILLDIGAVWCHWCHVMDRESYEDTTTAQIINENFIAIKVDRDERPDVDTRYQAAISAISGQGGWPLTAFLTPDGKPYFGGTYFPPEDRHGRPSFQRVLVTMAEAFASRRTEVDESAASVMNAIEHNEAFSGHDGELGPELVEKMVSSMLKSADLRNGGFGAQPKFPHSSALDLMLDVAQRSPRTKNAQAVCEAAKRLMTVTLDKMAKGGVYDQLAGGFHRYSVDAEWHVPHFEKMLYDQAQLVQSYLTAYQLTGEEAFAKVAHNVLHYVEHDLTSPEGGFFSAEDADSLPTANAARKLEGAFYVWPYAEIREVLGEDRLDEFCAVYGVEREGNVSAASDPHGELEGLNVLIQRMEMPEAAERFKRKLENMEHRISDDRSVLLAKRGLRPRPHLDDKILTAWNGLMIGAFARGSQVLGHAPYLRAAQRAATFVRDHLFDAATGELQRSYREGPSGIHGFAADYAFLISGLLDLYEADFDPGWLKWARQLQDTLDLHFWDAARGGYYSTTDKDPAILLRMKEDYDGAEPTPTSVAALNLWRMGQLFHNDVLLDHARHAVRAFSSRLEAQPFAMPLLLSVAALLEKPPIHLILHSPHPEHPGLAALLAEVRRRYLPQLVVIVIADEAARASFAPRHVVIENLPATVAEPTAYLCENHACQLPVTDPGQLRKMLSEL